jgi:hypothetical protein
MSDRDPVAALILDFVAWIAARPRRYTDVMEAWRTSCPRLTVWEDSLDQGYVVRKSRPGGETTVEVTPLDLDLLEASGRGKRI